MSEETTEIILHNDPKVSIQENLFTKEECEHLINLGKPHLENSVVSDSKGGYLSSGRTSRTAWISHFQDEITTKIATKIADLVKIPIENAEKFQLVHYGETNEYKAHYDSWDHDGSDKTLRCIKYGGPRMVTALIYLNDVEEGGSTKFTKLDLDVLPNTGKLLMFENTLKDSINKHPLSEHAGMPVIKGEKYICNLWFRQFNKSKLYSETNPSYYENLPSSISEIKEPQIVINNSHVNSLQVLREENKICKQDLFLDETECEGIIKACKFSNGKYPSAWLKNNDYPLIIAKLSVLVDTPYQYFESMNVIKYRSKDSHGPFLDASDIFSDQGKRNTERRGQRVKTMTMFLNDNIEFEFDRFNTKIVCNKGTLLCYDNVKNTRQRDNTMCHKITNVSDDDVHVLNIYIREKDLLGQINPSLKLTQPMPPTPPSQNSENIQLHIDEDFMETLSHVFSEFSKDNITSTWRGHKSFNYGFRGDFDYFKQCINEFGKLRNENKGLNLENVQKEYVFNEYSPVGVSDVISEDLLELLKSYYRKTINDKVFPLGDRQSNRFKAHNEPMSRFLHYEILPLVEKIAGKKLKPTYTYLSAYVGDSDLPAHTDRPDCEYTVSFLVNKDADWPIYLHKVKQPIKYKGRYDFTPEKSECLELHSDIGGLLIFDGTDHLHFREKYSGTYYDILLLHYRSYE